MENNFSDSESVFGRVLTVLQQPNLFFFMSELEKARVGLFFFQATEGHFTNGTFSAPRDVVAPTVLAGFQHAIDREREPAFLRAPLIIAVNSDKSMADIMEKKGASEAEKAALEDQMTRALKVGLPVARQFANRNVYIVFYDEETPNTLYQSLFFLGLAPQTLFKWGYGTDPDAGVIEGAENFDKVFAHPLPGDQKPLCHDITRKTGQEGKVQIVDLRTEVGPHGAPYISASGECLFHLTGVDKEPCVPGSKLDRSTKTEPKP